MIDWEGSSSHLLLNPRYSPEEKAQFNQILIQSPLSSHVWLATSGSSAQKWVGLSKQAILASAQAVNQHLQSDSTDCWIQALPDFHVGGLGVFARAHLSGASVRCVNGKWDPHAYYRFIQENNGTLSALVPTQLHDLVTLGLVAPASLRAVIIGGGRLPDELYAQAKQLQWNVLPSYGMTECASQIATAELKGDSALKVLPHIEVRTLSDGRLCFKGPSLLSVYAFCLPNGIEFKDPKEEGWLISEDRGCVENGFLTVFGRTDQMIKVGGESVNLAILETRLQDLRIKLKVETDMTLLAVPDERLGHAIHLVVAASSAESMQGIIDQFQQSVMPFERIRHVRCVPAIPRSALSKVLKKELLALLI